MSHGWDCIGILDGKPAIERVKRGGENSYGGIAVFVFKAFLPSDGPLMKLGIAVTAQDT